MGVGRPRPNTDLQRYGLFCPQCGRSILPVPIAGSFTCKSGHELSIDALISRTPEQRRSLSLLLEDWRERLLSLRATAADAKGHGFLEVAEIYYRQSKGLEARIAHLEMAIEQIGRLFDPKG